MDSARREALDVTRFMFGLRADAVAYFVEQCREHGVDAHGSALGFHATELRQYSDETLAAFVELRDGREPNG